MSTTTTNTDGYYIPQPSYYPIIGSAALLCLALGAVFLMNDIAAGPYVLFAGFAILVYFLFVWFGKVIGESESGKYSRQVDLSFRWSMSWFIFSEVMFFAAFFGTLFYMRVLSVPGLGTDATGEYLWPAFTPGWPTVGPGIDEKLEVMSAWGLPAINTLLLLSSGVTVTWAHWALKANNRGQLILSMILTIALGIIFLTLQAVEYHHAYTELGLNLSMGAYGATFFMLTGFHGLHVTIGTIMLIVILFRCMAGHFKPEHHFAFEAVSWYWHFVDVVWLLLFVLVYWL